MNIRSILLTTIAVTSASIMSPSVGLSWETAGLADDLGNATVSVLSKLGYDCKNASAGAIICKKCKADDLKQKCTVFTCDAVTKKCRKKSAELPNVPGLGGSSEDESSDGIELPSL